MPQQALPPFKIVRTRRRQTVALLLRADNSLEVRAPKHVSLEFISTFVHGRLGWIEKNQALQSSRPRLPRRTWHTGDVFYHTGAPYTLRVIAQKTVSVHQNGQTLTVSHPKPENPLRTRHHLLAWYRAEALRVFTPRLAALAHSMGEETPILRITNTKSRWGSCQGRKRVVHLAVRLLMASEAVQDYVMIHELAHLKHMNHSKKFWAHVATYYPNWKEQEASLQHNAGLWQFG